MKPLLATLLLLPLSLSAAPPASAPTPSSDILVPAKPVELTGTHGKFDFIKVDATRKRLLACHTGNGTLDVIDLATSKVLASVPTGGAQGVAVDDKGGRYFVSCSKPPKLVIIDADKLAVTGEVPLPGPADLCAYSPVLDQVFVDNDEKPEMWVVDPNANKIISTQIFPGKGMEDFAFDSSGKKLFQNLKDTSQLAAYFPLEKDWPAPWSTLPAEKPHGLALAEGDTVLVAGGTGKLALINFKTGQVVASTDIAPKVDEIAYDHGLLGRAYAASGTGVISVAFVGPTSLSTLGNVPSATGAHSIAVDPKTHTVWIAYAKGDKSYVQAFTAK